MNEEKIREIFDLCLRVSSETTAHVNFDYTACDDISRFYIYVFNEHNLPCNSAQGSKKNS